jgi:UDP-N-acetylmuramoyl-tripeptide--D-alanyl-D-alanine ligase
MINLNKLYNIENVLTNPNHNLNGSFSFEVDNRLISESSIFIAIVGERYNPLSEIQKIIDSGCRIVVYEKKSENDKLVSDYQEEIEFVAVDCIIGFIQNAGKEVATSFKETGGKVIAISGSNGKTTTKEMLYHLIDGVNPGEVICTQKNNNNHLGVPFTLFQIKENTKYAIIELGSNHPGEIETLCRIIKPQYGVTTNIGDTHLEFFQNRENVFKEEAILYNYTSEIFFKNNDDELLKKLENSSVVKSYGEGDNDYSILCDVSKAVINQKTISNSSLTGKHNFINLSVAYAICESILDFNGEKLIELASSFRPTANRSEWITRDDKKYFLDAYNANPSSMKVAVDGFLEHTSKNGISLSEVTLILGDMNELGSDASSFHRSTGKYVTDKKVGNIIFIGNFADDYDAPGSTNVNKFKSVDEMAADFKNITNNSKYIFIKGSRSLQLERILDIK